MSSSSSSSSSSSRSEASPRRTYRLMAGLAIVAMALIGLAIFSLSQIQPGGAPSPLKDLTLQPTLRKNLPQFEFTDESPSESLKPQDFAGKWTLLSFWAFWCGPCVEELPALDDLGQQWQGPEFDIVTVNVDEPQSENFDAAKKFLSEQDIALPTLFDQKGILKKAFAVNDLPHHFLISPDLKIVWEAVGAFKWNDMKTRDQLLKVMEDATEKDEATAEPSPSASPAGSAE